MVRNCVLTSKQLAKSFIGCFRFFPDRARFSSYKLGEAVENRETRNSIAKRDGLLRDSKKVHTATRIL